MSRMERWATALFLIGSCGAAHGQAPEAELRRLTECYVQALAPEWRAVEVVVITEPDTAWAGITDWNLIHRWTRVTYNLAQRGDRPLWRTALHEVLHLAQARVYYLSSRYVPEVVALQVAAEQTVEDMVRWPVWRGLCGVD